MSRGTAQWSPVPDSHVRARVDRPRRPLRGRQVPAGRAPRPAGPAARRLLQGRRRPDPAPDHRGRQRRDRGLGPPRLVAARRRAGRAHGPVPRRPCRGAGLRDRAERPLRLPQPLDLGGRPLFVAEGIFAPEVVPACSPAGMLAAAYCVRQHPVVTFWRRLTRDLREHRKPPLVLVRRARPAARPAPGGRARGRPRLRGGHAGRGLRPAGHRDCSPGMSLTDTGAGAGPSVPQPDQRTLRARGRW